MNKLLILVPTYVPEGERCEGCFYLKYLDADLTAICELFEFTVKGYVDEGVFDDYPKKCHDCLELSKKALLKRLHQKPHNKQKGGTKPCPTN